MNTLQKNKIKIQNLESEKKINLLYDEENKFLSIKIENLEDLSVLIDAPNTNLKFKVKRFEIESENEIILNSNLPKDQPSILLNCDKKEMEKILECRKFIE